jgi:hypothetical protein
VEYRSGSQDTDRRYQRISDSDALPTAIGLKTAA